MQTDAPPGRPHLIAGSWALLIAALCLAGGLWWAQQLERQHVDALFADFSDPKLHGMTLQKQAFAQDDLLVLYGSSELVQDLPANATQFFHDYPTGFRVFPVGKPGTTALAVLQKVAAVGPSIAGRKVAYSISPGYFFYEIFDPQYYEGNFSELQASELAFSPHLSRDLKCDVARRMLAFPKTLENDWLLATALERLAGDTPMDRFGYALLCPLGLLKNMIGRAQDHAEAVLHILDQEEKLNPNPKRGLRVLNWNNFLRAGAQLNAAVVKAKRAQVKRIRPKVSRDKPFIATISKAREWTDFELLLRTFQELGAQLLLLSMPIEDIRLEAGGLSPAARNAYLERLDGLARDYNFPLIAFREHEKNPGFLMDFFDHLSATGWLYYDKALDDFFHDRVEKLRLGGKAGPLVIPENPGNSPGVPPPVELSPATPSQPGALRP